MSLQPLDCAPFPDLIFTRNGSDKFSFAHICTPSFARHLTLDQAWSVAASNGAFYFLDQEKHAQATQAFAPPLLYVVEHPSGSKASLLRRRKHHKICLVPILSPVRDVTGQTR
jgi:hypothetical protein